MESMKTRNLLLFTCLTLLLTSCMPDSFTKFKEEPPSKKSASGGSAGSGGSGSGGSTTGAEADTSDIVFEVDSVDVFQESGDVIVFQINSEDFNIGDTINVSETALGPGVDNIGTVTAINKNNDTDETRWLAVTLNGSGVVGPEYYVKEGFFIDNCSFGYNIDGSTTCAPGSTAASNVTSAVYFFVSPEPPLVAGSLNFNKPITVTGTSAGGFSPATLAFDYTFSASPLGTGIINNTDTNQSNDRFVSPYGPFLMASSAEPQVISVTAAVSSVSDQYGVGLDAEEQGVTTIPIITQIPGTEVGSSTSNEVSYYHTAGERVAIVVENTSGFTVGATDVFSCRVSIPASCVANSSVISGRGNVDYIDKDNNVIFLTIFDYDDDDANLLNDSKSLFRAGNFIVQGSFVTPQTGNPKRIFKDTDTGVSLLPDWNNQNDATDDPNITSIFYEIDNLPEGYSFNSATGEITINNPTSSFDNNLTVTVRSSGTVAIIDSFVIETQNFGTPVGLEFPNTLTTLLTQQLIGSSQDIIWAIKRDTNSDNFSEATNADLWSKVYFVVTGDPDGAPFALPAGVAFDVPTVTAPFALPTGASAISERALLDSTPSTFMDGSGTYTISAYHPAFDPTTAFASLTFNWKTATDSISARFPQSNGDNLILEVGDSSQFSTATGSNNVSTPNGGIGTVQFIDTTNNKLFIRVDANLTGTQTFQVGDSLDRTSSYVIGRTTISDVIHIFDVSDTNSRFVGPTGLVPDLVNLSGTVVTLAAGETNTWAVTPAEPSDFGFNTTTGAFTTDTANNASILAPTEYTLAFTNELGFTRTSTYKMAIIESPTNASMARYQFVRLSGNGNRFFRGSRIQTSDDITGRVLMTIDINGDGTNDGLLLENNGDIADGVGLDNTAVHFANEATVEAFHFWYVKDSSVFGIGDIVVTENGDSATIRDIDSENDRLYVEIGSGTFTQGEVVEESGTPANNTVINTIENRHYVTGVIQIDSLAQWGNYVVGGPITSDNLGNGTGDSVGLVVQKHIDNNGTTGTTADDRHYLLIQHVSGVFQEGDTLDNSMTFNAGTANGSISRVVGPVIDVTISAGAVGGISSSSTRVDSNGNPFFEGMLIGNFERTTKNYTSVGYAVAGTDYASSKVVVNVEDYFNHFFRNTGAAGANDTYLDDFSESTVTSVDTQTHNQVQNVGLTNLMIGYVGEAFHLEPFVKGAFESATIAPEVLPEGLTFNTATGRITGTPTQPSYVTNYTVTFIASDGVGSTSYSFPMVIYNQFEVAHTTDQASSYIIHREGQGLANSRCKVFGPQVIDDLSNPNYNQAIYGTNDIICLFEGGESDLFNRGIDFNIKAGSGMCEYIQYTPFSYDAFYPGTTNRQITTFAPFADASSCIDPGGGPTFSYTGNAITSGIVDSTELSSSGLPIAGRAFGQSYCESGDCVQNLSASSICSYDYSHLGSGYPNADGGEVTVTNVTCSYDEADTSDPADGTIDEIECNCTFSTQTINCNGEALNTLAGAKRTSSLEVTDRSQIIPSFVGIDRTESVESPITKGYGSNRYISNFISSRNYASTAANSCHASDFNMDSYGTAGTLTTNRADWGGYSNSVDPFGNSNAGTHDNYYTWNCLDSAFNVKARIRVLVRDWDLEFTPENAELENLNPTLKLNNVSQSCFGLDCDAFQDHDTRWLYSDFAGNTTEPLYGSCGDSTTTAIASTAIGGGLTISVSSGSSVGILSGALPADHVFPTGTMIYVESGVSAGGLDASDIPLMTQGGSGNVITFASLPGFTAAGLNFYIVQKLPYPGDLPN